MARSHDQNFKNLILDYPRDALAFFAAEEAPAPEDDVRVTPLRQEQLKERLGDRFRELDAPLLVQWTDGRRKAVLFVVEEETEPRRFSPYRLAHYCLDLAQMFETDRVVPVTIFLRGVDAVPASLALGTERSTYLARTIHECPTAADDPLAVAVRTRSGPLDIVRSYAFGFLHSVRPATAASRRPRYAHP